MGVFCVVFWLELGGHRSAHQKAKYFPIIWNCDFSYLSLGQDNTRLLPERVAHEYLPNNLIPVANDVMAFLKPISKVSLVALADVY
jgi:hypothetical protein